MSYNYSRTMTALELKNSMKNFAIEIDEVELIAFITAGMLKEWFPELDLKGLNKDELDHELEKGEKLLTKNDFINFFATIMVNSKHAEILGMLGAVITHRILVEENDENINNKEVN